MTTANGAQPTGADAYASKVDLGKLRRQHLVEKVIGWALFAAGALSVLTTIGVVAVLLFEALEFFREIPITDFLFGTKWTALFKDPSFGVVPLVTATVMVSVLAMLISVPLGLLSAVYLSEYASQNVRSILKPFLELLAGIPTIVLGYFALTFITPEIIQRLFADAQVYNVLAAAIAIGIMTIPLVSSLSEDALRSVPLSLREAGYAAGATKYEVATKIVFPAALSGIVASVILAISRAIGETMIVSLAAGSKAQIAKNPLEPAQPMTGYIVQVVSGDVVSGSVVYKSLFAVGLLLFVLTFLMNVLSHWIVSRYREEYQ